MNNPDLKKKLHSLCAEIVQQKIYIAKQAMDSAQQSANQEEKSSAGDKYETGRAMAQIERDQAAQQLDEALKLKNVLDQITSTSPSNKVVLGSLVTTDQNVFYISISAGKIELEGKTFFAVSTQSPIGVELLNRKQGDVFVFNKLKQTILKIE
jgi:transcription elongation GreA/GreB family factor